MTFGQEEALLGGVTPRYVVDVSQTSATYRADGSTSSVDELAVALDEAASYRSPAMLILIVGAIAATVAAVVEPVLFIVVAIATAVLLFWANARAARTRCVAVLYRLDRTAARSFDSLSNGVGWLGSSRGVWRITHEELAQRPTNSTSFTRVGAHVSRGDAAKLLTNVAVPSVVAGSETLLFLPDALLIRDHASNSLAVPYTSIDVSVETIRFTESHFDPGDSQCVGHTWLYAKKDGSRDRRRALPCIQPADAGARLCAGHIVVATLGLRAARLERSSRSALCELAAGHFSTILIRASGTFLPHARRRATTHCGGDDAQK